MSQALLRLLVIEDSEDDAELLLRLLRKDGFDVRHKRVETEEDLVRALSDRKWDLVISDHTLPGLSSTRALSHVRKHDLDLPFVVVSGTIREQDAVALLKAGASDYLLKDRLSRLAPAVRREIEEARLRREHRMAQAEIERAQSRYRSLIDNAVVGVCRAGYGGKFTFVNGALVAMLRYPSVDALLACDPGMDVFRDPRDLERLLALAPHEKVEGLEVEWRGHDGRPMSVRIWARAAPHAGTPHGFEMFVEDVTERSELRRQLVQAQKMEAVGRLAGGIAHDFNNLLVAILGYADLLRDGLDPADPRVRCVDQIQKAGERAADLTHRLLAFSRRGVLIRAPIQMNDVVKDVLVMLERVIGNDVVLQSRLDATLPPVLADRGQLEQVLMNLVVNARDAMPHGGNLVITTSLMQPESAVPAIPASVPPGRYVRLTVEDSGVGMSEDVMGHLFEPFFTTKDAGKGTGLGLSTVYGIVTSFGGALRVTSDVGAGTTFEVILPEATLRADSPGQSPESAMPVLRVPGGETILLVDDDAAVRDLSKEVLERAGYVVLPAASAREAVLTIKGHAGPVDAVVADIALPDMSGPSLAEVLCEARPDLPVLFTSGYTSHSIDLQALRRLRAPLLQKPFRADVLLRMVAAMLSGLDDPSAATRRR